MKKLEITFFGTWFWHKWINFVRKIFICESQEVFIKFLQPEYLWGSSDCSLNNFLFKYEKQNFRDSTKISLFRRKRAQKTMCISRLFQIDFYIPNRLFLCFKILPSKLPKKPHWHLARIFTRYANNEPTFGRKNLTISVLIFSPNILT